LAATTEEDLKHSAIAFTLAALILLPAMGRAALIQNPDPNTLWTFDGKDISLGSKPGQWRAGEIDVKSADGGGLLFNAQGKGHSTGHYVPLDADYPYLVLDIADVKNGQGYRALNIFLSGVKETSMAAMVSYLQTGRFILRMFPENVTPPKQAFLSLYLYNTAITVKILKMVKAPADNLQIIPPPGAQQVSPGDEVTFRLTLEKPAEDATLTFYNSYTMPQVTLNGQTRLQLKPEDDAQKIWSAKIKLTAITRVGGNEGLDFKPGGLMVKTTILGGAFKEPLWTWNLVPFNFKQVKK
jgi:hypothetical protein